MEMLKKSIENMYSKGLKINEVSRLLQIKSKELRKIMLDLDIYPSKNDKEYGYFESAKTIKEQLSSAYFLVDLINLTGLSKSRVMMICKMYDLKPCKKVYCAVCGKEIKGEGAVKKYCSTECYNKNARMKRKKSEPTIRTCLVCGKEFVGKTNSKFCSDECRPYLRRKKEQING